MKFRILIVSSIALFPTLAFGQDAQSYQCSYGDLQRRVEILYETGGNLPCEVHYHKDSEAPGQPQVLWRAMNQAGYCEEKTEAFVAKLVASGWDCGQGTAPADPDSVGARHAGDPEMPAEPVSPEEPEAVADPEAVDDTDALEPATDDSNND